MAKIIELLSLAAECAIPEIEADLQRRISSRRGGESGEERLHFTSQQNYQDKADVKHLIFRNPDEPLRSNIRLPIPSRRSGLI